MFPFQRNRRLRNNNAIRSLVQENRVSVSDFIVPVFVVEGTNIKEEITSMPNYFRFSLDLIEEEVKELWNLGLKAVLIFVKVPDNLKDNKGTEALNPDGLMQRAIRKIKELVPEMIVMTDVALDPYSSYGHDGIVEEGYVVNDATVEVLSEMALSHAKAGADFVAPSDMMDGRIENIRLTLERAGFYNIGIMSYSANRDALDSAPGFGDKKTYQMDPANRKEALSETLLDIKQGADIVMVKPGLAYLDIVRDLGNQVDVPVAVYQVSGEYAMLKAAAEKGWLNHDEIMMEQLLAFKRAGASLIASYFAKDVARLLK